MTGKKKTARIIIMNHHQSRHTQTANRKQRDSRMEPRLRRCEKVNVLSGSRCLVAPLNVTNCRSERWWIGGGGSTMGEWLGVTCTLSTSPQSCSPTALWIYFTASGGKKGDRCPETGAFIWDAHMSKVFCGKVLCATGKLKVKWEASHENNWYSTFLH